MVPAFLALVALFPAMAVAWAFQRARRNGGWTDVFWSFATGAACVACALLPGPEITVRQAVVAGLAGLWGLRLGVHIATRVAASPEDARYAELRQTWGPRFQPKMFWFLQSQAAAGAVLAAAAGLSAHNPAPFGRGQDLAALGLVLLALGGEALADAQLRRFKADPAHHGAIADQGLWGWSRHPNYFFEWLAWLAYVPLALSPGYPQGWGALAAPVMMWVLLNYVSGVPPVEGSMRRSRGAAFAAYQARTSRFFPLPPRLSGARP